MPSTLNFLLVKIHGLWLIYQSPDILDIATRFFGDIRSGAMVLLGRQQWSVGRILYLFLSKKSVM
jgi:hypothetical protein